MNGNLNEDQKFTLELIASLSLADHLGDVANDICDVLKKLNQKDILREAKDDGEFWPGLRKGLDAAGIKTIYGTRVWDGKEYPPRQRYEESYESLV